MKNLLLTLRSAVFWVLFALSTAFFGGTSWLLYLLPDRLRYRGIIQWARFNIWILKVVCGIHYRFEGMDNLPDRASIILANHQSTWETMVFPSYLPRQTWVVKRELIRIPFFGWGINVTRPIAIDRKAGRNAIDQVAEQGKRLLEDGIWVVVFPEGTRVAPGETKRFKLGGARLAASAGAPVVPIAHNAGKCWPRHQFIKIPGTITVSIGKPIESEGRTAEDIGKEAEQWIRAEMARLDEL